MKEKVVLCSCGGVVGILISSAFVKSMSAGPNLLQEILLLAFGTIVGAVFAPLIAVLFRRFLEEDCANSTGFTKVMRVCAVVHVLAYGAFLLSVPFQLSGGESRLIALWFATNGLVMMGTTTAMISRSFLQHLAEISRSG